MSKPVDFTKPLDFKALAATMKKVYAGTAKPGAVWVAGVLYILKKGKYERATEQHLS